MSSSYLDLTNRVLRAFNEVNLTSGTFASAVGFHSDVKDAINQAILDIYTFEDTEWPFAFATTNFDTTSGTGAYTKSSVITGVDWQSFRIGRGDTSCFTLTQTAGTATFTSNSAHRFITGDSIIISGADQTEYNGEFTITVVNSTLFTFSVASTATSPATGTIIGRSNSVLQSKLWFKDIDSYRDEYYSDVDANRNDNGYSRPRFIVRTSDNNFILSPTPDRTYNIYYEGFALPASMTSYSDTSSIPTVFDQVIIDKALHFAYMFRDNVEQATLAQSRYEDNVRRMRRILIPMQEFFRYTD